MQGVMFGCYPWLIKPMGDDVVVDPYYDPDKVGSGHQPGAGALLYIPDRAKNPMSQQGLVVGIGPQQKDIEVGDYILFHPWVGRAFTVKEHEYLNLHYWDVVGWLAPDGILFPLPDSVVVKPIFKPRGPTLSGSIYLLRQVFHIEPPQMGMVVRTGERCKVVRPRQTVMFGLHAGNEIGLVDTVWYTIKEEDLLATVEAPC